MGRICIALLVKGDFHDVNLIVFFVRAEPDNQQNLIVVIDSHNQAVVIALDVKDHPLAGDDAGRSELGLKF